MLAEQQRWPRSCVCTERTAPVMAGSTVFQALQGWRLDPAANISQVEDDLPLEFAKKCLDEPSLLLTSDSQHIQQIKK